MSVSKWQYNRGTQREYSSKPLKHRIVKRILVWPKFAAAGLPTNLRNAQLASFFLIRLYFCSSPSPRKGKSPKTTKTPSKKGATSQSTSPKASPSKNYTEIPKRVRDCCASWHDVVLKWSKLNELGTTVANKLVNFRLQKE